MSRAYEICEELRRDGDGCNGAGRDGGGRDGDHHQEPGCICEPLSIYEDEVARRWWNLSLYTYIPLDNGKTCQLLYAGRAGSVAGPDIHDAVLYFHEIGERCVGDIELHVRASDWYTHMHHTDARYNNVILHVVLVCDNATSVRRQDGTIIPMCSLNDIPLAQSNQPAHLQTAWPCQTIMLAMSDEERDKLLLRAGLLRFEQKAHAFVEQLHATMQESKQPLSSYDACLIVALAEGLGYGRDRPLFRAIGDYLLGKTQHIPEPLGRTPEPAPLDARRLHILRNLVQQWSVCGAWETMKQALIYQPREPWYPQELAPGYLVHSFHALRTIFADLGQARADILICNVVLPFAGAVGLIENNALLVERAQQLFATYPQLSSNRITRAMQKQLQMAHEPRGACRQQGLHYIYQQTCREKWCEQCIVGRERL
ncbi:MAG TPA: DUF2851 family protein [Ktedonobacteraceae bacterium]|nr:DUF2851 family protein [Ktedonobacteraceae bacterium]